MVIYVSSFLPLVLVISGVTTSRIVADLYFINHISNFFIYLAVNSEFRKQVKQLVYELQHKEQPVVYFIR